MNVLRIEDFKELLAKYPLEWPQIELVANNHSDRICATFGVQSYNRTAKALWKRALVKVKYMGVWSHLVKDNSNNINRSWIRK